MARSRYASIGCLQVSDLLDGLATVGGQGRVVDFQHARLPPDMIPLAAVQFLAERFPELWLLIQGNLFCHGRLKAGCQVRNEANMEGLRRSPWVMIGRGVICGMAWPRRSPSWGTVCV